MATIHNPTHFEPSDYEVEDYLDNRRPQYYGQDIDSWRLEIADWEAENARIFGADWIRKIHACVHCGNGRVRWITAVRHIPTGEVVVFGADCTERLGFANRKAFKLALLQKKAEGIKGRLKIWNARVAFLEAHPQFVVAIEAVKTNPVHAGNRFAHDVVRKLDQYGSLSDKQVNGVIASLQRDIEFAARKAAQVEEVKGDAPEGRVEVTGEVLSVQERETHFGFVTKMLVKLGNNSKVWVTVPSGSGIERGDMATFKATFERSRDDKSFAFGSRPFIVNVVKPAAPAAA